MSLIRQGLCIAAVICAATDVTAQAPAAGGFQSSPELFVRLFPANRLCRGCTDRPGRGHMVMDSPRLTRAWLARHHYQSNGGQFGDNATIADFWYDAVHRRIFSRSLVLQEVDDPADLRLGRAPGRYPNNPDFTARLPVGETVGHIGFMQWSPNGFGAYFAALQGSAGEGLTGYLDLSATTGIAGRSRTGVTYSADELVKHVRLHPAGQLEVGFDTSPDARPDPLLLVRGNVQIEGTLTVSGTAVPAAVCGVRSATGTGRSSTAVCDAGRVATGGGGTCAAGEMRGSRPLLAVDPPVGWEVSCSEEGLHTAYVICCPQ